MIIEEYERVFKKEKEREIGKILGRKLFCYKLPVINNVKFVVQYRRDRLDRQV